MQDDVIRSLRRRQAVVEQRLELVEKRLFRACAGGGVIAGIGGLVLPFLVPSDTAAETPSIPLIVAVFALPGVGDGPLRSQAALAGIVSGGYLLLSVVGLVAVLIMWGRPSMRKARFGRTVATLLLIASGCAALFVVILAVHFDGAVTPFSPAVVSIGIQAALTIIACRIHPILTG